MTAGELIEALKAVPSDARVLMGYDGDIVVTGANSVEFLAEEPDISSCWWSAHKGDVVILCNE